MSWNNSLYTNVGTNMMSEVLSGATMTITKAVGGAGTTAAESLAALTDVKDQKQTLKILGIEDATDSTGSDAGKRIKIQITNEDVETGYILHQVGIYAKLADGNETLLIIMQDDRGVEIPSHAENSDFEIELYGIMAISNLANISVTVDPNAVASVAMMNQQIEQVHLLSALLQQDGGLVPQLLKKLAKLLRRFAALFFRFFLFLLVLVHKALLL